MDFLQLGSKGPVDQDKLILKLRNRHRWRHGFSQCEVCKAKLMAYLDKGHTLDDVIEIFRQRKPHIKNHRRYAMNAIRQTTGDGYFDNYIVERGLWTPRNPIMAQGDEAERIRQYQKVLAIKGRFLLDMEKI
jgi:hypothetical protein